MPSKGTKQDNLSMNFSTMHSPNTGVPPETVRAMYRMHACSVPYYVSCIQMFVSHAMCVASILWSGQYIYRAEGIDSRGSINFGNRVYTIIIG